MSDNPIATPVAFTLGEAAKAAGISKPTLSKALKTGRLSGEKQADGSYRIMASELFRVYQPATPGNGSANAVFVASATLSDTRLTEQQIDGLREQLALRERERGQLL